ncbi:DNA-3-methyladenine glycosylase family protein [Amycolatopsis alkalitolerans]|uniref:DNA-3-methyladenine glycosylase II n=1 Tax=Amycolatopsis alkalitolerans TaxID=2547244 RepID=A0A5C4LZG1_9PSEU|nr:DNA-3-methyladenine glycosylase [Amycolatopsis alkalitolerans]TNC24615.1 DNA-3-methyladenine glycosylase 2 family protein [Amycolatopsis alkalitolerans]
MTSTLHQPAVLHAEGPFDLAASARFLEGFTPAARPDAAGEPGVLRLAFPVEGSWRHAGALVRQRTLGSVEVSVVAGEEEAEAVVRQVRRILSLDVDGEGFLAAGERDPVVGRLQARYPGLRPVLFHSPYEAACWTIIGNRIRMSQAARIKQRIAERHGEAVEVGGQRLASFPEPRALQAIEQPMGLPEVKIERLRAIARAAQEGLLEAESLRAFDPGEALERLQQLPGIGPFSAQLILVRGAGHPDVFPDKEQRLHEEMRELYALPAATAADLAAVADGWRPYRSWVALLFRSHREARLAEQS